MTPQDVLDAAYESALTEMPLLSAAQLAWVQQITENSESQKAVLAALITSLVKKAVSPRQDIRWHKVEMPGGYSGRVFDTNHVTPFLARRDRFPRLAMKSGSGWLTRSIEQNSPFTLAFTGKIQNPQVKAAFLSILDDVEVNQQSPQEYLHAVFQLLRRKAEVSSVLLAPTAAAGQMRIETIVGLLHAHFFSPYVGAGASRLPVLAIYALYTLIMPGSARYAGKRLLPLKSHTASDAKSASIGDVEIADAEGNFFEAVEIKHRIAISPFLVEAAFDKFSDLPLSRYYLLTTAEPNTAEAGHLSEVVQRIRQTHGCEVIVNGILPTVKYYLRLIEDPSAFITAYNAILAADYGASTDLKDVHLKRWQELLAECALAAATKETKQ